MTPRERGKKVYFAHCIACHHVDPAKSGPIGPELKGSPRALVDARVLRVEYPPGYQPKRSTTLMKPMPELAGDIDALVEFLK